MDISKSVIEMYEEILNNISNKRYKLWFIFYKCIYTSSSSNAATSITPSIEGNLNVFTEHADHEEATNDNNEQTDDNRNEQANNDNDEVSDDAIEIYENINSNHDNGNDRNITPHVSIDHDQNNLNIFEMINASRSMWEKDNKN